MHAEPETDGQGRPIQIEGIIQGLIAHQLFSQVIATLRRQAQATAACLWVRIDDGMRLHAADPADLPVGEILPSPSGALAEVADEGVIRLVSAPAEEEAFWQIPFIEDRLQSAAVALLPVGDDEGSHRAVLSLHLPTVPEDVSSRMFEWARWVDLLKVFLPVDTEPDPTATDSGEAGAADRTLGIQTLSAGLARRVNERLAHILPSLQQAIRLTGEHEPAMRFLCYVEEGINRTSDLMARLLAYAADEPLIAETVSIVDCVAESLRRLEPERPHQVRLKASIPTGLPLIVADRVQIRAALMEVIRNALEVAPEGTEVEVAVEQEDDGISITVVDEGTGMKENVLRRATTPFFTTKRPAEHPGLGLSTAQGCVHRHGGRLSMTSQTGAGTTIRIWFPLQLNPPAI